MHLRGFFIHSTTKQNPLSIFKSKSCFHADRWNIKRDKCFFNFRFMWDCPWEEIYSLEMTGGNLEWNCLLSIESPKKGASDVKHEQTTSLHCTGAIRQHTCWPPVPPIKAARGSTWNRIRLKDVRSSRPSLCCPCLATSSRVSFHFTEFLA